MDIVFLILISALHIHWSLAISTHHVRAVSPRDYYRNNPPPPDKTNWEIGLKEATYQALLREQVTEPRLKEEIYSATISDYQDTATPFGDIAVVARGQLYTTPHGYQFAQDPYQNDCDDCHNTAHRCHQQQCEPHTNNIDNLLALWTVKRIRHRDPKYGHRYELHFTISPITAAQYTSRNGQFDYTLPGHVFVVKLKENGEASRLQSLRSHVRFDKEHKSGSIHNELKILPWTHHPDVYPHDIHQQNTPNSILLNTGEYYHHKEKPNSNNHVFNPGFLIGVSPNGYKHLVHDLPGLVADRPYTEQKHYKSRPQDSTTQEPVKHYHHHFYIPEVADIDDYERKVIQPVLPTILTTSTRDQQQFLTNFKPTVTTKNTQTPKFIYTTHDYLNHQTNPQQSTKIPSKFVYTTQNGHEPQTNVQQSTKVPPKFIYTTQQLPETNVQELTKIPPKFIYTTQQLPETNVQELTKIPPKIIYTTPNVYDHHTNVQQTTKIDPTKFIYTTQNVHDQSTNPHQATKVPTKFIYTTHQNVPENNVQQSGEVIPPSTTGQEYYKTTYKYPQSTVPITINPTHQNVPENNVQQSGEVIPPSTTGQEYYKTTYKYPQSTVPITINPTLYTHDVNYQTESNYEDNTPNYPQTTILFTVPDAAPTKPTRFNPSPFYIQYSDPDPNNNNYEPPTVSMFVTQTVHPTTQPTAPTYVTYLDEDQRRTTYDEVTQTTTATPTTVKNQKFPDSINAQLPPPDRGLDTTIPYVASTIMSIVSTPSPDYSSEDYSTENDKKQTTLQEKYDTTTESTTRPHTTKLRKRIQTTTIPTIIDFGTTATVTDSTTRISNINADIFDVTNIPTKTTKKSNANDYDIFGESKISTIKTTASTSTTNNRPNAYDEIFSKFTPSTEYSNIRQSMQSNKSALRNTRLSKYLKYKHNKSNLTPKLKITESAQKPNTTDQNHIETKTSQSYITSISFKVNKNKNPAASSTTPTLNENETEFRPKRPVTKHTTTENTPTFNDVAQTLVNHARIESILHKRTTKPTRGSYRSTSR